MFDLRWLDYHGLVKFKLVRPGASLPKRGTGASGALDVYAPESGFADPGESVLIPLGIAHDIHPGFSISVTALCSDGTHRQVDMPLQLQGMLIPRSGLAAKNKLRLFFAPCLIDHDYRGEIHAMLENQSEETVRWSMGERICQIGYVPMYMGPVQEVAELSETERGSGGFGHTGRH